MGFLKKLFGGDEKKSESGILIYVRLDQSGEVVRLRLFSAQELNKNYEGEGYFCRKMIMGPKSFQRAEATFIFDEARRLVDAEIEGGTLVDEAAWRETQE